MRGSGHLPQPEMLAIGLRGRTAAEHDHIGLALQHEHRHARVVADAFRYRPQHRPDLLVLRCTGRHPGAPECHAARAAAVHEEPVVYLGLRVDRVDVGHQEERRLRLAQGDQPPGARHAERRRRRRAEQGADLAEDVERPGVARMLEQPVPVGRQQLEVDPLDHATAVDAGLLHGHPDPDVAAPGQLPLQQGPVGGHVHPGRDVVPLHRDRPAERGRIDRAPDEYPGHVGRLGVLFHAPAAVGGPLPGQREGPGHALDQEFLLDVADRLQGVGGDQDRGTSLDRADRGNGSFHHR